VNVLGLRGEANMQLRLVDVVMTSVLAIVERPGFSQGLTPWRGTREARSWCRRWSSEARLRGLSRRLGAPAR
jgi:hypothetical protein